MRTSFYFLKWGRSGVIKWESILKMGVIRWEQNVKNKKGFAQWQVWKWVNVVVHTRHVFLGRAPRGVIIGYVFISELSDYMPYLS